MTQKIIKVGTSSAVVLPKEYLKKLNLRAGDTIFITLNEKKGIFEIDPEIKRVDAGTLDWTKKFIKKYRPALEALAKK